jgi:hypothetical protein
MWDSNAKTMRPALSIEIEALHPCCLGGASDAHRLDISRFQGRWGFFSPVPESLSEVIRAADANAGGRGKVFS